MVRFTKRQLISLCLNYEFLQCKVNCSDTLCTEIIPDHIPKEQILKFIEILLAREDHYLKGNT